MKRLVAAAVAALVLAIAAPVVAQTPEHSFENVTIANPDDGTTIAAVVFKPGTASADARVPVILHSHGWGGSKASSIRGEVKAFLDAGFGVVSFDQRGHGDSSGQAHVQDPTKETEDVKAVIDHIASLPWVLHDTDASGASIANDPVLGAIGGSYGGGYQTMTSLDEIADEGGTRFDALSPEITWYDLPESLAPQKVVRSAWNVVLYGAGAPMVPDYIHEAFVWGSSTGQWPDGTLYGESVPVAPDLDSEFHEHSPVGFVEQGIKLDIPVLQRQGTSDNLFNLNQGLDIFHKALTGSARSQSYFVAYNGGHALPNVLPHGEPLDAQLGGGDDACSGDWTELRIAFFKRALFGQSTTGILPARYNLTDLPGTGCLRYNAGDRSSVAVDPVGAGAAIATAGVGAPLQYEVAEGPLTITGVPKLKGLVTSAGLDNRAFFGLSVGTSPADASVIQNNLMPLRVIQPQVDAPFDIELPGVAVTVPEGESLFLTVSPLSDMYFGHGTRGAGGLVLSDVELTLPNPVALTATKLTLHRVGWGDNAKLVARLTEKESGAGIAKAPIDFSTNGVDLGTAATGRSGWASVPLTGKNRYTGRTYIAEFAGTDTLQAAIATKKH